MDQKIINISCLYQNVRGVRTRVGQFSMSSQENKSDIIAVSETWLRDGISSGELFNGRYVVFRKQD